MNYKVVKVTTAPELDQCYAIRQKVFVEGQNVPQSEELDGKDEHSEHYLLWVDAQAVGTARVRFADDFAKIERVAILDSFQGLGLGKAIMSVILDDLKTGTQVFRAQLSSQTHALPFYQKLGFTICSAPYIDANISHQDMYIEWSAS